MKDIQVNGEGKTDRMNGVRLFLIAMLFMGTLAGTPAQTPERISSAYNKQLLRVFEYRDSLEGVHPFVRNLYPIAIAEDGHFYVFDLDDSLKTYRIMAHEEIQMQVPKGVRAAFPLAFYDNKCACVVTGDVFDTPQGYVTIFHEFIHCHQWNTVEPELRKRLPLAQKAAEKEDYMWELNHPFPYQDAWFVQTYTAFLRAAQAGEHAEVAHLRSELSSILSEDDYQYMVWQEWKEGFALLMENKIRVHLGLPENTVGRTTPYNRTVFYAGGSAFIRHLSREEPVLLTDLEELFYTMY